MAGVGPRRVQMRWLGPACIACELLRFAPATETTERGTSSAAEAHMLFNLGVGYPLSNRFNCEGTLVVLCY